MKAVKTLYRGNSITYTNATGPTSDAEAGTGFVDVDNSSISITTVGKPILIILAGSNTVSLNETFTGNTAGTSNLRIIRDSATVVFLHVFRGSGGGAAAFNGTGFPAILLWEEIAAGTYNYKLQQDNVGGSGTNANGIRLFVYEMGT